MKKLQTDNDVEENDEYLIVWLWWQWLWYDRRNLLIIY